MIGMKSKSSASPDYWGSDLRNVLLLERTIKDCEVDRQNLVQRNRSESSRRSKLIAHPYNANNSETNQELYVCSPSNKTGCQLLLQFEFNSGRDVFSGDSTTLGNKVGCTPGVDLPCFLLRTMLPR